MARKTGFSVRQRGDFKRIKRFLSRTAEWDSWLIKQLKTIGNDGVTALREATPKSSGKTALRWSYEIRRDRHGNLTLSFQNESTSKNAPNIIALLVYGHATKNGKWVEGRDFVTPAIDPIFAKVQELIRREAEHIGY